VCVIAGGNCVIYLETMECVDSRQSMRLLNEMELLFACFVDSLAISLHYSFRRVDCCVHLYLFTWCSHRLLCVHLPWKHDKLSLWPQSTKDL